MAEVQTITQVKSFDDVITEFDSVETQDVKNEFSSNVSKVDEVLDSVNTEEGKKEEVKEVDIDKIVTEVEKEEEEGTTQTTTVPPVYSAINKLVEKGEFFLFDDKQDLSQYTEEELIELIQENDKFKTNQVVEKQISEFFESLPEELQIAAKYVSDGGSDLRGLLKSLSETVDVKSLDPSKDAEKIIRSYYSALEWDDEEINDKINNLKDLGKEALEKESSKVKPKLDKMSEEVIALELKKQEGIKKAQMEDMQKYFQNAAETIKKGVIGEVKLDTKKQVDLYKGLTEANYQSRKGLPTNKLGHLLEKYQYIEPDFEKMYKVLWLLEDEEAFLESFSRKKVNETTQKTVRTLKTEQSKKDASSNIEDADDKIKKKTATIKRPVDFMAGINSK